MPESYIPIGILLLITAGFGLVMLFLGTFVRPFRPTREKASTYESGMVPVGDARERFTIRFYVIAMLFVLFDIEAIFLYPWAILFDQLGLYGLVEMALFIALLLVAYAYAWRKGALDWVR